MSFCHSSRYLYYPDVCSCGLLNEDQERFLSRSYLRDQLRSPTVWKLRQSFFPGKQFGRGISPRVTFYAMVADEAFLALVELYLPFPHQVSIFYPSNYGGYRRRQLTTAGNSFLLLSRFLVA